MNTIKCTYCSTEVGDLPKATNGSDFTISFDAEGILNLTTPQ